MDVRQTLFKNQQCRIWNQTWNTKRSYNSVNSMWGENKARLKEFMIWSEKTAVQSESFSLNTILLMMVQVWSAAYSSKGWILLLWVQSIPVLWLVYSSLYTFVPIYRRVYIRYLSDGVVGLSHTFSEVSWLWCAPRPGGSTSLCDAAGQGWSWGQDVVHCFCCGLQSKYNMFYLHNITLQWPGPNL